MLNSVAVIGSGSWGTALAVLLANKGNNVKLWSFLKEETDELIKFKENKRYMTGVILPYNVDCSSDLEYCLKDCEFVISAVPSKGVRGTAKEMAKYLDVKKQVVVSVSKGLDAETYMRLSEVIREEIKGVKMAVLSGPSHAEEVARHMPTTNVVAADSMEIAEKVQDLFMYQNFRVYINNDMAGVEYGGSLKNVIALCAGIIDGLGLGDNAKAALMTRGMTEIARLGTAMGAKLETFFGLTGMGDLIVTCTSMHSRNRRAGILIGQGKTAQQAIEEVKMVVEGVPAAVAGYKLSQKMGIEMPITEQAYKVLFENKSVKEAILGLMSRQRCHEIEETIFYKQ